MSPLISVPRQALAQLLQSAGSTLTPEQFVASLSGQGTFLRYPGRARVAAINRNTLVVVTAFGILVLLASPGWENLLITVGLAVVTYFETRVLRYFREQNPAAPGLGFRNQSCFAAAILIYGLYSAFTASQLLVPGEMRDMVDAGTLATLQSFARIFYLMIGVIGGLSQFAVACYYRGAKAPAAISGA